jgi:hypothetical protein
MAFGKLERLMSGGLAGEEGTTVTVSSHLYALTDTSALTQHPRNSLCMSELFRRLPLQMHSERRIHRHKAAVAFLFEPADLISIS